MDHHNHYHHHHHHEDSTMHLMPDNNTARLATLGQEDEDKQAAVLMVKGITMLVLCSVSICMGLLPLQMNKWLKWTSPKNGNSARSSKLMSMLLGFGGGVLLCTTFLHLLPEVTEGVESLIEHKYINRQRFPIPETLTCLGFFIMYLVEELVHTRLRHKKRHASSQFKVDVNHSTNELVENGKDHLSLPNGRNHATKAPSLEEETRIVLYGTFDQVCKKREIQIVKLDSCTGHSHLPITDDGESFEISSLRGLLIVLGLSVHELFEGLAIGLESSAPDVWYMFAAVSAHKFVIAFCIGVQLIAAKTKTHLSIVYICMFAVVSPLGIGIGMALIGGESAAANGLLPVFLQGIASGTLLYVVFFEVLQENRSGLRQFASIVVGFILMMGLQSLMAHSHSHGHSHGEEHHEEHDEGKAPAIERVTDSIVNAVSKAL
ncbi:zinc transporter ZIP1-like isoform X2 [Leptopilina boulardi]|uniref:zinc transporter ZIP1-like isoform X2 n=1 Tax=Leptopilina boulardi TaxID=63433 RepID=UPI0021F61808|nr:zinc transporter ZIP1-like isoform X2 [Leptopilina boulardi]XP_051165421.1 zinc transporter ZIP1-like isoform X2 [Leptopilina boulardi]XP_051165422.1 zinc transporter ZIP1-like isoform X2 [Leptopilina boulardi]